MPAPDRLTIVTHRYAGTLGDQALLDIASFYGINSESFDLDKVDLHFVLESAMRQPRACIAVAASTLVHLSAERRRSFRNCIERAPNATLLIHSIVPEAGRGVDWLGEFLMAEAKLVKPAGDRLVEWHFTKRRPETTGPLTGVTIGRINPATDSLLLIGRGVAPPLPVMTPGTEKVGGETIFAHCRLGGGSVCLISAHPPDESYLDEGMAPWLTPERVTRLLPLMLFVRGIFGAACWHNPQPRAVFVWPNARVVQRPCEIDLRDVAGEAQRLGQHVALAVPAGEFARFEPAAARLVRQYLNHLSVVPYGNVGLPEELAAPLDRFSQALARPVPQSLRRMGEFGQRAKVVWSKVMVAPGGECHASQTADLREYGYRLLLGRPDPRPADSPWRRHHGLEPASLDKGVYPTAPILRDDLPEQALIDAFLGKPLLMELRPEWFAPDAGAATRMAMERLAALEIRPRWSDLETLSRSLYLMRRCGSAVEIRMFAREVEVEGVDLAQEQVEVIPPLPSTVPFRRLELDVARESQWQPTPAGDLLFEVLGEASAAPGGAVLRLAMRCEPPELRNVPLGDSGVKLLDRVKRFFQGLPLERLRPTKTARPSRTILR